MTPATFEDEIFQTPLLQCVPENIIYDLYAPTSQAVNHHIYNANDLIAEAFNEEFTLK